MSCDKVTELDRIVSELDTESARRSDKKAARRAYYAQLKETKDAERQAMVDRMEQKAEEERKHLEELKKLAEEEEKKWMEALEEYEEEMRKRDEEMMEAERRGGMSKEQLECDPEWKRRYEVGKSDGEKQFKNEFDFEEWARYDEIPEEDWSDDETDDIHNRELRICWYEDVMRTERMLEMQERGGLSGRAAFWNAWDWDDDPRFYRIGEW